MKRVRIKVAGIVQGVGYRAFAKKHAQYLGLTGFTRNNPDGSVTIEAQGKTEVLAIYMNLMEKGPQSSEVRHFNIEEIELVVDETAFYVTV